METKPTNILIAREKSGKGTSLILNEGVGERAVLVQVVGEDGVRKEDGHGEERRHERLEEEHHELEDEEGPEAAARLLPTEAALEVGVEAAQHADNFLHSVHVFGEDSALERLRRRLFLRLKSSVMDAAFNGAP